MRSKRWLVVALTLALTGGSACAESDFDFEELMKDVETRIQNVQNNISAGDVNTAAADTKALQDSFALVEGYFAKRGDAADAVVDAKNYQDKAVSIQAALTTGNATGAADAAGEFSRQCRGACHDKYKPL